MRSILITFLNHIQHILEHIPALKPYFHDVSVIYSLRKYDVERQDFMERDYDHRAGYKHHQTRQYLTAMQEGLMEICEREHLHQVDLLSPAADNITDREYRLTQRRQQAEIEESADTAHAPSKDPGSFQSQKQFLRDAIREVSSYAKSPEEFGKELYYYYGIRFKISRGRFSYLHPDRRKYMTGRTLGNDYTEAYLLPLFEGNKNSGRTREQMLSEQKNTTSYHLEEATHHDVADNRPDYDPSYDYASNPVAALHFRTKLRLVVDLQTCAKAQASRAYARKVKLTNLQHMAQAICYVQEHGINTETELKNLCRQQEQLLLESAKSDPSYQRLRRNVRELQVVCLNVRIILQSQPQKEHLRSIEKAQDLF